MTALSRLADIKLPIQAVGACPHGLKRGRQTGWRVQGAEVDPAWQPSSDSAQACTVLAGAFIVSGPHLPFLPFHKQGLEALLIELLLLTVCFIFRLLLLQQAAKNTHFNTRQEVPQLQAMQTQYCLGRRAIHQDTTCCFL